ncbi:hypothetical protein WICMUC_003687 [Wickerhamomyces mucosus]|uniref:Uncharacterized protein n=1 Tax=Wickerhamomyces mucosus TaxID=1378264 RepID=A0A9P8TBG1_9ASCO|nr:hypothetical protein WICMUC_003687 [Wickerhamomyces mucosus]
MIKKLAKIIKSRKITPTVTKTPATLALLPQKLPLDADCDLESFKSLPEVLLDIDDDGVDDGVVVFIVVPSVTP